MGEDTVPRTNNIVILGGSIGGLGTAHYLLRHVIKDFPTHKVVIICPNNRFLWRPACPRAAVSESFARDDRLLVDFSKILQQYPSSHFQHVQGSAVSVDGATVRVDLAAGGKEILHFDALVVATGASTPSPLLGLTKDDAALQESWATFHRALPTAKRIVIAGGGPAGVETAGELGELLNGRKGWFKNPAKKVSITVVTAGTQILPHLRPSIAETAERYLREVGVEVLKGTRVQSVSPEDAGLASNLTTKSTIQLDTGSSIDCDLYVPAIGTKPNTSFMDRSLLAEDGRIKVNPSTLRVDGVTPRIYAVGDVSTYARPTVHSMFDAIPTLGANLKRDLLLAAGRERDVTKEDRKFVEDTRETQFVPIGSGQGVGAVMGWRLPSWLVSVVKGRNYLLWTTGGIITGKQWAKE